MTTSINVEKLDHAGNLPLPAYATAQSAGMDLLAAIDEPITIEPGKASIIPTGLRMIIPEGHEGQVRSRSGLAARNGVAVLNSPGTIDADYRGEVKVILINHGESPFVVERGMRIAQYIVAPCTHISWNEVNTLDDETDRGDGGFGSTGLKAAS